MAVLRKKNYVWPVISLLCLIVIACLDHFLGDTAAEDLQSEDVPIFFVGEFLTSATELGVAEETCLPVIWDSSAEFDERMKALKEYVAVLDRKEKREDKIQLCRDVMIDMAQAGDLTPVFKALLAEYGLKKDSQPSSAEHASLQWLFTQRLTNLVNVYKKDPKKLSQQLKSFIKEARKQKLPEQVAAAEKRLNQ